MNKIKTVEMDENFQEILVSAVRYALGRMTYIVVGFIIGTFVGGHCGYLHIVLVFRECQMEG